MDALPGHVLFVPKRKSRTGFKQRLVIEPNWSTPHMQGIYRFVCHSFLFLLHFDVICDPLTEQTHAAYDQHVLFVKCRRIFNYSSFLHIIILNNPRGNCLPRKQELSFGLLLAPEKMREKRSN